MAPEWMNWEGWRWIAPFLGMAIGIWFGWDVRGTRERSRRLLRKFDTSERVAALEARVTRLETPAIVVRGDIPPGVLIDALRAGDIHFVRAPHDPA